MNSPQDLDAERAVLGGIMLINEAFDEVAAIVRGEDFYRDFHGAVFESMGELSRAREPIDILTVGQRMKARGAFGDDTQGMLASLDAAVPSTSNLAKYARRVRDVSTRRALMAVAVDTLTAAQDETKELDDVLQTAEARVLDVRDSRGVVREVLPIGASVRRVYKRIADAADADRPFTGVSSGYKDLDKLSSGFKGGDVTIVAARSSHGKSTFARNLAEHAVLREGLAALVFSLEDEEDTLTERLLSSSANIDSQRLASGKIVGDEWTRLARACDRWHKAKLYVDDSPSITIPDMRARVRRVLKREPSLGLVICDYIQLMKSIRRGFNREQEVAEQARGLKELAREFRLPVIALAQLNRGVDARADKRPTLADLRESGAIEHHADAVILLYVEDPMATTSPAEAILAKQRKGPKGTVRLTFRKDLSRFEGEEGSEWG